MAEAPKFKRVTSPKGVALYPALNSPDTKFVPEGVYHCKLAFDPNDEAWAAFKEKVNGIVDEVLEYYKNEKPKLKKKLKPLYPFVEETDGNGEETGREIFQTPKQAAVVKRKKDDKPIKLSVKLFDSKGKEIDPKTIDVGHGTTAKVAFDPVPYHKADDNSVGVALRLKAVQIIELSTYGASAEDMGFEEEEGFEYDEEAAKARLKKDEEKEDDSSDDPAEPEDDAGTDGDTDF